MIPQLQNVPNIHQTVPNDAVRELFDVVLRRKWIIIQALVFFTVVGAVAAALSPPIYRTGAKLLLEAPGSLVVSQVDTRSSLSPLMAMRQQRNIDTQLAILQSAEFRKKVMANFREGIDKGRFPEPTLKAGVSLSFSQVENTSIIGISAESTDREAAAIHANLSAEAYCELTQDSNKKAINLTRDYLKSVCDRAKRDLAAAEAKLLEFSRRTEMSDSEEQRSIRLKDAIDRDARARQTRNELLALEARVAGIEKRLAAEPENVKQVRETPNPEYEALREHVARVRAERTAKAAIFLDSSPPIQELDDQITTLEQARQKLVPTVRTETDIPNPARLELESDLKKAELERDATSALNQALQANAVTTAGAVKQFAPWQVELSQLQRERNLSEKTYMDYSEKLRDLNVRERAIAATASVMESAVVPSTPVRPNRAQQVLTAMVIGLALGMGFAYLQEILDDRVNTSEDIERLTALPTLGVVPTVSPDKEPLLFAHNAFSTLTESYRALRTALQYSGIEHPIRTLLLTSAHPREGKSTTSANLAIAVALQGKRVILVDTDMRHPSIHKAFRMPVEPGLSNVLAGELTLDEALKPTSVDGLQVLTCGPLPPNPAEILNSQPMRDLLAALKERSDIVILDTPPVLPVTDGQVLAGSVDSVMLVVEAGRTRKSDLKHAYGLLEPSRARILGTVLNKIDQTSKGYYYYHYYYRGGYGKYSGYGDNHTVASLGAPTREPAETPPAPDGSGTNGA